MNILKTTFNELLEGRSTITNERFLEITKDVYGEKKIRAICQRYNLFSSKNISKKLKLKDVEKIQIGLKDITSSDLDRLIKKIHLNKPFTTFENAVLNTLNLEQKEALKNYKETSELPAKLFNDLLQAFKAVSAELEFSHFSLSLSKISGLPGKYFQHGWLSHQSGRSLEDAERLSIYEEIHNLSANDQANYCELMAKIVVKKHLYYETKESKTLKLGMLVPGLKGADGEPRWYRVSDIMDSGWGKFAYRLVPATKAYPADMPDFLLYRSSAALPTAMDSFTSYLNDFSILPPGYLSRNCCKKQELRWFSEPTASSDSGLRPLLVTGHSLGASNCQISLMNIQKSGKWPNRNVSLELFDSSGSTFN